MKKLRNIASWLLVVAMFCGVCNISFAETRKDLILTGNLYSFNGSEYVLNVADVNALRALDGKNLGFKFKTVSDESTTEEVTEILGSRCDTIKDNNNSSVIFNAIRSMLVPSSDNKTLTFKLGSSGSENHFNQLENLLNTRLNHKVENVIVTYYDDRVSGDSTVQMRVIYKFGNPVHTSSSSSYSFVIDESVKKEDDKNCKNSNDYKIKTSKNIDNSAIMNSFKFEEKVLTKLGSDMDTIISKSLLSNLMWTKYQEKTLIFEKYNDKQSLLYRWTLPAKNINREEKFDINIFCKNEKVDEIAKTKFSRYNIVSFAQKGTLPVTCKVEVVMDFEGLDQQKLKIYAVNLEKKTIEETKKNFVIKDGLLVLENVCYGDDYIIAN